MHKPKFGCAKPMAKATRSAVNQLRPKRRLVHHATRRQRQRERLMLGNDPAWLVSCSGRVSQVAIPVRLAGIACSAAKHAGPMPQRSAAF